MPPPRRPNILSQGWLCRWALCPDLVVIVASFTSWLSDAWQWQRIFHVATGSTQHSTSRAAPSVDWQQNWQFQSISDAATASATFTIAPEGQKAWHSSTRMRQTQFVWKILLVTVHILNVTQRQPQKQQHQRINISVMWILYTNGRQKKSRKKIKNYIL